MTKMLQPHPLRVDELMTITCEIEALLNSRPLVSAESVNTDDELVLTPGHFIIYRPLELCAPLPVSGAQISSLRRWQLVNRLNQDLERAWKGDYIQSLQQRSKWNKAQENVRVDQLVYIKDQELMKSDSHWGK